MESTNAMMKRVLEAGSWGNGTASPYFDEQPRLERFERVTRYDKTAMDYKAALELSEQTRLKLCDALRSSRRWNAGLGIGVTLLWIALSIVAMGR